MKRKILALILIFSMVIIPSTRDLPKVHATPLLKEPIKWIIKKEIKKETKSLIESTIVKEGVRTTEKKALEKANERWFQRLPENAVVGLQESAARAVPAATPGWLKTVVGATMFLTGADLVADIADYLKAKNSVDYYSDDAYLKSSGETTRTKVANGFYLHMFNKIGDNAYFDIAKNGKYYSLKVVGGSRGPSSQKVLDISYSTVYLYQVSSTQYKIGVDMPYITYRRATYPNDRSKDFEGPLKMYTTETFTMDSGPLEPTLLYDYADGFDFDSTIQPETIPMPSDMADLWPGETRAVEITFPDPNFFPDTTGTVIANPHIVTNPIPETKPSEQPTTASNPSPQPTETPNPSAQPSTEPSPSTEPTPNVDPTPSAVPSTQPTNPPVVGGEDPDPTSAPDDDDDDGYSGPTIDSPLTPEEALALGWEDITPPLIKEYKDPKTGTVVKFNTKTLEITYTKYFEVEIINTEGKPIGEIDEIDMEKEIFYEDKQAKGLNIINPSTGLPAQTAQQWADKQILVKTRNRIQALRDGTATRVTKNGSKIIPEIESIRNFKEFVFRLDGDSLELKQATENAVNLLAQEFPGFKFSATFGRK
ncbi:hypothetical protein C162_03137 [Paenibacillus sp. FSL R7-269]|uniref:hypothetical protein n=1 Tax=Paenibacillus sp. FSL R7-269 TaxID=1226755 RepID=UPI0003E27D60|nr:hypothetical protein [Paenibacillus sp. FSL R7-269]ETT55417.1 hypothetical protein C162_03137 [Paenibacillus sp. FSL R7-269]